MSTLVLGERPPELEQFLARRRALGQDLFDETWAGSYHVAPPTSFSHGRVEAELAAALRPAAERADLVMTGPFDLGESDDYRPARPRRGRPRRRGRLAVSTRSRPAGG